MIDDGEDRRVAALSHALSRPVPAAAEALGARIAERHPGSAIVLYGSGGSILSDSDPTNLLYDFYVIAPSYRAAYASPFLRFLNWLIPPNVFYFETPAGGVVLRAKYAVLSIGHFERLVGKGTFHSYFWARFAQPCRIVSASAELRRRIEASIVKAIDTFVARTAPLAGDGASVREIWRAGLDRSYKAELRAEQPERVAALLESYGDWPQEVTRIPTGALGKRKALSAFAWRMRAMQGGAFSVARLLKGMITFKGGVDYIAWKVSRHAGFTLPVKDWERRWPLLGAPFLARRYYRMRKKIKSECED